MPLWNTFRITGLSDTIPTDLDVIWWIQYYLILDNYSGPHLQPTIFEEGHIEKIEFGVLKNRIKVFPTQV